MNNLSNIYVYWWFSEFIYMYSIFVIYSGTLWCGLGDIARDDLELGAHKELDMCCRAHDKCEDFVEPKSSRYGLQNKHICRL